jgi:hypothetical protein
VLERNGTFCGVRKRRFVLPPAMRWFERRDRAIAAEPIALDAEVSVLLGEVSLRAF